MKKLILILLGAIPFLVGYLMVDLIYGPFANTVIPYKLIGVVFLFAWFVVGRYSYHLVPNPRTAIFLGNLVALIALLIVLYQEIVLGQYWSNQIGAATQLYYFALINLASIPTMMFHTMPPTYIAAFLMMCIVFHFGHRTSNRDTK